ncbi:MAG: ribosome maturation factor RimM [Erysipelotrichaceae bacterium]|nr:ribosome maturation factor RimM [Erysipelotrichaceae bacterium]
MELVRVGIIVNTFGIKGEVKVQIITDFPEDRFQPKNELYIKKKETVTKLIIKSCRYHQNNALILFEDYEDINLVEQFKGFELYVDKASIKALADGYYSNELMGLEVYHESVLIGKVINIEFYPAHSILRVRNNDKDVLIPFIDNFITKVDVDNKRIDVTLIDGMI